MESASSALQISSWSFVEIRNFRIPKLGKMGSLSVEYKQWELKKKLTGIWENGPNEIYRTGLFDSNTVNRIDLT